jgi:hypothetical protein
MNHDPAVPGGAAAPDEDGLPDKLRRRIAVEAARGVTDGSDARRAVFRAARRVARGWVPDDRLPGHDEVRREVQQQIDPDRSVAQLAGDRFAVLGALVGTLVTVRQNPATHPEGDLLEHTLQVFARVHHERPYDEELLTAALVHDLGKTIDRSAPAAAAVEALGDLITPRTRWFVESLQAALAYAAHTLGHRARARLEAHPDFEDVLLLAEADRLAHVRGGEAPGLDEALAVLRGLDAESDP